MADAAAPFEILIRRAGRDDLPAIVDLDETVGGERRTLYWDDVYERFAIEKPLDRHFLVAETDNQDGHRHLGCVIGEVEAWEFGAEPCGWIFAIQVEPGSRERKVGTLLLGALLDSFRSAGVSTVRTLVASDNHLLLSFYRAQGMSGGPYIQLEMPLAAEEDD